MTARDPLATEAAVRASTDEPFARAQLEAGPMKLRDAIHWARSCHSHCSHGMYELLANAAESMLAAKPHPALPERLYEEDAVAIAEKLLADGWYLTTGKSVQAFWIAAYQHVSAPPKPPAPKTKTVWVVRASWAKPEARTAATPCTDDHSARSLAELHLRTGAISLTITEEARPCSTTR